MWILRSYGFLAKVLSNSDHLRDRYNFAERQFQAHVKAIVQSQINLDDNCIYDLVPGIFFGTFIR